MNWFVFFGIVFGAGLIYYKIATRNRLPTGPLTQRKSLLNVRDNYPELIPVIVLVSVITCIILVAASVSATEANIYQNLQHII